MDFFFFIKVKIKMVCFSVPSFEVGGFLLNGSTEPSIYKLSSRAPRFFCPGTGMFSYYPIVRIRTVYAVNILLTSSRMLIVAL